jgi:hypothetical protein
MTTIEMVKKYINQLCIDAGADPEKIYSATNNAWYFSRGASTLEVFLSSNETSENKTRTFIRCFSTIYPIPVDTIKRMELYYVALEVNARNMGVKIGTMANKGYMYAIGERDIDGMDYAEFVTLVSDVGYWADHLDELFKQQFGGPETNLN